MAHGPHRCATTPCAAQNLFFVKRARSRIMAFLHPSRGLGTSPPRQRNASITAYGTCWRKNARTLFLVLIWRVLTISLIDVPTTLCHPPPPRATSTSGPVLGSTLTCFCVALCLLCPPFFSPPSSWLALLQTSLVGLGTLSEYSARRSGAVLVRERRKDSQTPCGLTRSSSGLQGSPFFAS